MAMDGEDSALPLDPLWSIERAAEYLDVSVRMVRQLVFQRRIEVVKVGRLVRIRRSEIERFLTENTRRKV